MSGVLLVKTELGEQWVNIKRESGKLPCSLDLVYSVRQGEQGLSIFTITQRLDKFDTAAERKKAVEQHLTKIKQVKADLQNCMHELENLEGKQEILLLFCC
jgi:hypothetical protein